MRRVLVRSGSKLYRLFAYEFRDHSDGSLYIHFKTCDRPGRPSKSEKISYHTTGRIKFDGPLQHVIFGEPIFALTETNHIACLSLASLEDLPAVEDQRPTDFVIDVAANKGERANAYFWLAPPNTTQPAGLAIRYEKWFSLIVIFGQPPVAEIAPGKTIVFPADSRQEKQLVPQSQALIFFHQKRNDTKGLMLFWDDKVGEARVIFSVPMRIHPALAVEFVDQHYCVEPQAPRTTNTATAELRFKVRGPKGYEKALPPIKSLTLDAEFYDSGVLAASSSSD